MSDHDISLKLILEKVKAEPLALVSLFVSLFGTIFGIYFNFQNVEQLKLQINDARQIATDERSIVFTANFGEADRRFVIKPIEPNFAVLQANIFFPKFLIEAPQPANPDGGVWGMATVEFRLKDYLKQRFSPVNGKLQIVTLNMPIVIQSRYVVKGRAFDDLSTYFLNCRAIIDEKGIVSQLEMVSLLFGEHFDPNSIKPDELLTFLTEKITAESKKTSY